MVANCLVGAGGQTCILCKNSYVLCYPEPSFEPTSSVFISRCLCRGERTTCRLVPSFYRVGVGVGTQVVRPGRSAFAHRVVSLARSSSFSIKSGAFGEVLTDEKELGCQHAAYDAGGRAFMLLRKPLYAIKMLTPERHLRGARPGHGC